VPHRWGFGIEASGEAEGSESESESESEFEFEFENESHYCELIGVMIISEARQIFGLSRESRTVPDRLEIPSEIRD
jgi:hypothetical protein